MASLKDKRRERGYTVIEMAEALNVTERTVYNWEKHPEDLTVSKAVDICTYLDCTLDDIFLPECVK